MVEGAEERWRKLEPKMETIEERVKLIESILQASNLEEMQKSLLTNELYLREEFFCLQTQRHR